ncbi:RNA-guided endonuclease IscB [Alicyclobacillus sendaiensis]|uniref:RNA-guided endonuclease IscB n=1 Tax=Alicyclobacillus sendaiensis TaxID=192387 RepID=UPI0026F44410|nr:RNA-guided endonuclease IscB [Alicyclobacillus sendaiensis]
MRQNRVLVLDTHRRPLMPCHPARARQLLKAGRASVFRRYPFTIILRERDGGDVQATQLKLAPGSKTTGVALVAEFQRGKTVVWAAEIQHRSDQIRQALLRRRMLRRGRRYRKTRYRKPRFDNRRRPEGWLPPSLMSRVHNIETWVTRLRRWAPITHLSMQLVSFDTQKLQYPEISGVEYQHCTLYGYEVREYLLEKWGRKCAYCGAENVPLEIDHVIPRSRGGSDRVSNLVLACHRCNQAKGNRPVEEFLAHDQERLHRIQAQLKLSLRDAAAMNATRWAVFRRLKDTGLPVEAGSGGRTKYNRFSQGYPKAKWIDAACVGESGQYVGLDTQMQVLTIVAKGHGKRQRCITDKYGFPRSHAPSSRSYMGFRTGDLVRAHILRGKYAGTHAGRIVIRHRPSFKLNGFNVHPKHLKLLQRGDGYAYNVR